MAVKRSHSGSRILAVLEAIAMHQPAGVSALARLLNEDKSAVQRALLTLADEGWIRPCAEPPTRWELTAHIFAVANAAYGSNDLLRRARPTLLQLRDETGESVLLAVPDGKRCVIADVVESRQMLRMVPHVGDLIEPRNTATGRAMLAFMPPAQQTALLGAEPEPALRESLEQTRRLGYASSAGETNPAATNLAAPILGFDGTPTAVLVVCAPRERLLPDLYDTVGGALVRAAQALSTHSKNLRDRGIDS